jgi:hypothetical protein
LGDFLEHGWRRCGAEAAGLRNEKIFLFLRRGRLTAPIIAHGLFDMLAVIGLFVLYR